jgi:hypothetical protein
MFRFVVLTAVKMSMLTFQVFTEASVKMTVFWNVTSLIALIMEAASISETSVNFYHS